MHALLPFSGYLKPNTKDEEQRNVKAYEDLRELISTWPTRPSATEMGPDFRLTRHRDSWYAPDWVMLGAVAAQNHFEARPTDVLAASFPKSGTTWIKALLFAATHCRGTRGQREEAARLLATFNPHEFVPTIEMQVYNATVAGIPDMQALPEPQLFHTHVPFLSVPESVRTSGCRVVYLWRDPKDVIVSRWHFVNSYRKKHGLPQVALDLMVENFIKGFCPYGPYWDHVLGYWRYSSENPGKVLFLRYEEIVEDPVRNVRRLLDFIDRPLSQEEEKEGLLEDIVQLCSIGSMKEMQANENDNETNFGGVCVENASFFRNGKKGDSIVYLAQEMTEKINHITKLQFGPFGIPYDA